MYLIKNRQMEMFFAESRHGFLLQQCLGGTPVGRPQPALRHLHTTSLDRPKAPDSPAPRSHRGRRLSLAAAMTPASPSQVRQNYRQDWEAAINRQINLEL
uniref:ferritin, mitochondrial-like n=1 Tax=Callithrix jacchus TaxID=9483 RepID=UPI000840102B|nr:ferritin, mitochondrial-like [Callithrix jacchus]